MATLSPFLASFILLFSLSFIQQCFTSGSGRNGLRIKLIHPESPESPIYPGNISSHERFLMYAKQTKARIRARAKGRTTHPYSIRAPVATDGSMYLVKAGIGTFANQNPGYQQQYLTFDTGSSFIWTQCKGCNPCYHQTSPLYDYESSQTYHPRSCNNNGDCIMDYYSCVEGFCEYAEEYSDYSKTVGKLATERFTFDSDNGMPEILEGFMFGCGLHQTDFHEYNPAEENVIAGILGMGTGPTSFSTQLSERHLGGERFSCCLPLLGAGGQVPNTFLEFGNAAQFRPNQRPVHTPLATINGYLHVNLLDITVGTTRLNFAPGSFQYRPDTEEGGCEVDLGSPYIIMQKNVFDIVIEQHRNWFARFPAVVEVALLRKFLCYRQGGLGFNAFPAITFHLENADIRLSPSQAYIFINNNDGNFFCLGIRPPPKDFPPMVVFGNRMLTNRRFVFDHQMGQLSFANEICGN